MCPDTVRGVSPMSLLLIIDCSAFTADILLEYQHGRIIRIWTHRQCHPWRFFVSYFLTGRQRILCGSQVVSSVVIQVSELLIRQVLLRKNLGRFETSGTTEHANELIRHVRGGLDGWWSYVNFRIIACAWVEGHFVTIVFVHPIFNSFY